MPIFRVIFERADIYACEIELHCLGYAQAAGRRGAQAGFSSSLCDGRNHRGRFKQFSLLARRILLGSAEGVPSLIDDLVGYAIYKLGKVRQIEKAQNTF